MSKSPVRAGVDIGYGTTDGVCSAPDGSKKPFEFVLPSLVCESNGEDVMVEGSVLRKRNVETIKVGARWYEVGEDVHSTVKVLSDDYIESDYYMALFYASLRRFKHERIDHLVTGLPVFQFEERRETLASRLRGHHNVDDKLEVNVSRVTVIPQPLGSLIEFFARSNIRDPRAINAVVVDPGHYSFDWLAVINGTVDYQQSGSLSEGVSRIIDLVIELIKKDHGGDAPSYEMIDRTLRQGQQHARMYGTPILLKPYLEKACEIQVEKAIRAMKNKLKKSKEIDVFVMTGGGASLYAPLVKRAYDKHRVDVMSHSMTANAYGYFRQSGK